MCTLVVAANLVPDHPLVIVANRDEQLDRASAPPSWWKDEHGQPTFFAPRDLVAGGTWLGLNRHGLFVAITNRFLGPRDATRTSRGALVTEALACTSAKEAHTRMAKVDASAFNGFHLVYADANDVLGTVGDGAILTQFTLGAGLTIVTERSFGAGDATKRIRRIEAAWANPSVSHDDNGLTKLLAEHDPDDLLAATCIHVPEIRYGTRSALVLRTDAGTAEGELPTVLWADGPPCTTAFSRLDLRLPD